MNQTIVITIRRLVTILVFAALITVSAAGLTTQRNNIIDESLKLQDPVLLIPDSTDDTVGMYDPYDGNLPGCIN